MKPKHEANAGMRMIRSALVGNTDDTTIQYLQRLYVRDYEQYRRHVGILPIDDAVKTRLFDL